MPAAIPIMIGLTAASTAVQVTGQVKAGNAAKQAGLDQQAAAESQAQLSEYNAKVADLQAQDATTRGQLDADRFRTQVRAMVGTQRAHYGASGVDASYGTPVDVQADTKRLGELDMLTIRTNAAREAWGYQTQAADLRTQAEIQRKEGAYAAKSGAAAQGASRWAAAGSIIGGASSLLAAKYGFGNSGGGVPTYSSVPYGPNP